LCVIEPFFAAIGRKQRRKPPDFPRTENLSFIDFVLSGSEKCIHNLHDLFFTDHFGEQSDSESDNGSINDGCSKMHVVQVEHHMNVDSNDVYISLDF
jgi:hypothetical protein